MKYPVGRLQASLKDLDFVESRADGKYDRYGLAQRVEKAFGWVLDDFTPVHTARVTRLGPGGYIALHRDEGPHYERWQIPIRPAGRFVVDGVELVQEAGMPFRVEHWKWHEVINDTDRTRIHLLIDREVVVRTDRTFLEFAWPCWTF